MTVAAAAAEAGGAQQQPHQQQQEQPTSKQMLVTFDVDGTLITSVGDQANKLHKEAFAAGLLEVLGLDTSIDCVPHHGSTDPLIILKVAEHCGIPAAQARLKEVEAAMLRHFAAHEQARAGAGLSLLPGVPELLTALQARGDVLTGLVTGNLEPIGWGKMRALGIQHLFSQPLLGGFGSDLCSGNFAEAWRDRAQFVGLAVRRAAERCSSGSDRGSGSSGIAADGAAANTALRGVWHVGDTPADVRAAIAAGARALGVCTGVFSRHQLEEAGLAADALPGQLVILDSLADTAAVLKALQLD